MFCKYCGNEITEDTSFCTRCGKSVKESIAEPEIDLISQSTEGEKKYDIILINAGARKLDLIRTVQKTYKVGLAEAKAMVEEAPFVLDRGLSENDAKAYVSAMESIGVKVIAHESGNEKSEITLSAREEKRERKTESCEAGSGKKSFIVGVTLKTVSINISLLAAVFALFLPVFLNTNTGKSYSLFNLCYSAIETLLSGSFGYWTVFNVLYIVIGAWTVVLIVKEIKRLIEQIAKLLKFEKFYKNECGKDREELGVAEMIKNLKSEQKGQLWYSIIIEMLFMFWISGFNGIVVGSVIVLAVCLVSGFVIEKIADWQIKKAKEI